MLQQLLNESYEDWTGWSVCRPGDTTGIAALQPLGGAAGRSTRTTGSEAFLVDVRRRTEDAAGVLVRGPAPAMMPKRAGVWRAQLLLQATSRKALERCLEDWLRDPTKRPGKWDADVDPLDIA